MKPAARTELLGVEGAFDVLSRARALEAQGRSIIHLEIGEPDFPTPAHIVEAGKRALDEGFTHYGPTMGLPELREAIAADIARTRHLPSASAAQVCVTPGAKPALLYALASTLNPGDEVLLPDPGFPIYASLVRYLGAIPIGVDFSDLNAVRSLWTPQTRMLILNSPHNPTGAIIPEPDIRALAHWAIADDVIVVSDEIYRTIYFGEPPFSIASVPGMETRTIIIDGFSKSHAMTGWRLGFGFFPPFLTDAVSKLVVNSNSCTATFVQRAGIAALTGPQQPCLDMVAEFHRRRDAFVNCLASIKGFSSKAPEGAFYAFPDVTQTGWEAKELAHHLLVGAGVAVLSGSAFGQRGASHIRFSLANSMSNLTLAVQQIGSWMERSY